MHQLAILIPAYKARFFSEALDSIANQTNKDFHLYIGDDNSPENLKTIVDEFRNRITLTYVRFNENLGGSDLVAQWERCIALINNEEWVWLFSDDDVMAPNCVEEFYKNVSSDINPPLLYHFNVDVINENGEISEKQRYFPDKLNAVDFLLGKMNAKYRSYVVEYIFNHKAYEQVGGFPKFDLAWNSDDAMWFQLAEQSLIKTIPDAKVYWRASDLNLSRIKEDKTITERKLIADLKFLNWISPQIIINTKNGSRLKKQLIYWFFTRLYRAKNILDTSQISKFRSQFHEQVYSPTLTIIPRIKVKVVQSVFYRTGVKIKKSIFD